jgi:arylsulfatase A-like enzyme
VHDPVGQLDLAATFCEIAGVPVPDWVQGAPLPTADGAPGRERVLCEWDSQFPGYGMHLRTIYRDCKVCTVYEKSTGGQPNGLEKVLGDSVLHPGPIQYEGTEGELYDLGEDPLQWHNLWDDPAHASIKDDLIADLYDHLPTEVRHLEVEAPA